MNAEQSLLYLRDRADVYNLGTLCYPILDNPKFKVWSGSSQANRHHYGKGGLVIHTAEVAKLCFMNAALLDVDIDEKSLFLAALFHDVGKMWDYAPLNSKMIDWQATNHKRLVHHITRSALVWQQSIDRYRRENTLTYFASKYDDDVLHAILSHHGSKDFGSPVSPKGRLAWMLHLCDGISARMNDADRMDRQ